MSDFEHIFESGGDWPDYLKCNHCGERVERGIVRVSHHWMNCLKRTEGLIIAETETDKQILDSMSINVVNGEKQW